MNGNEMVIKNVSGAILEMVRRNWLDFYSLDVHRAGMYTTYRLTATSKAGEVFVSTRLKAMLDEVAVTQHHSPGYDSYRDYDATVELYAYKEEAGA